ncbi:phosphatidate cytidylyltransferase [Thermostilla marina]
MDAVTWGLMGGVLALLIVATTVVRIARRRIDEGLNPAIVETFWSRVRAWWLLFAGLAGALLLGKTATIVLFGVVSFWALREFITLTPTRPSDHRALFWVFFLCTPVQYVFVGFGWYHLYAVVIPVFALTLMPARIALSNDPKRFLERSAKIQSGLLICVYFLSFAAALLTLGGEDAWGRNTRLLFFFVLLTQLSDALQFAWSHLPTKHVIAPNINNSRTWEGVLGGCASVTLLGALLTPVTPFESVWITAGMSLVIAVMGFAGAMTMSAIKRDRGVRDYGTLVEGHGGLLDRIDSVCFAAPVFFHLVQWYLQYVQ